MSALVVGQKQDVGYHPQAVSLVASGKIAPPELVESLLAISPAELDGLAFGPFVLVVRPPEDDDLGAIAKDLSRCALRDAPVRSERPGWVPTTEFPTMPAISSEPSETDQIELLSELAAAPHVLVPLRGLGRPITLGRAPTCDIVLGDPSVSAHHAEFLLTDGGTRLVDTDSKNGTSLNGRRLQREQAPWLQSMDRLTFGRIQAFVCDPRVLRAVLRQDLRTLI